MECATDGEGAKLQGDMLQGMVMAGIACAQHGISIIEVQPSCLAGTQGQSLPPSPRTAQAPFGNVAYGCLAPSRSLSTRASYDAHGSASRNNSCEIGGGPSRNSSAADTPSHLTRASSGSRSSCDANMRGGNGNGGGTCAAAGSSAPSSGSLFGCGGLMARMNGEGWQAGEGAGAAAGAAANQGADARSFGRSISGALAARSGGGKGGVTGEEPMLPYLGRIVYVNPAFEAQVGQPLGALQAQGAGLGVLLGPASDYQDVHTLSEALRSNRPATVKLLCYHQAEQGSTTWTSLSLTPISHGTPNPTAAASTNECQQAPLSRANPGGPEQGALTPPPPPPTPARSHESSPSSAHATAAGNPAAPAPTQPTKTTPSQQQHLPPLSPSHSYSSFIDAPPSLTGTWSPKPRRPGHASTSTPATSVASSTQGDTSQRGSTEGAHPSAGSNVGAAHVGHAASATPLPSSANPTAVAPSSQRPSAAGSGVSTSGSARKATQSDHAAAGAVEKRPRPSAAGSGTAEATVLPVAVATIADNLQQQKQQQQQQQQQQQEHARQQAKQQQSVVTGCSSAPVYYLCVQHDMSAHVSESMGWRLRDHALGSCSEGIAITDPSQPGHPLVYVNDAFLHITGYQRSEVLGHSSSFLHGPSTSPSALAVLEAAQTGRHKATVELINYRQNGETFWNRASITPVFDSLGRLVSFIHVHSDITELVRRKEEEGRLLEAKIAAETAAEAKSMFLANMSHEIRTPLNGMMATAQLLLSSSLNPEQRELADTILESGNSLLGVLGDILDFSKLDHGAVELAVEPVSIRRTVEACMDIVALEAQHKGLALAYSLDPLLACNHLMADPIRLRQVLANLLSNAVKFTDVGEVQVDASLLPRSQLPPTALSKLASLALQPAAFAGEGGPPASLPPSAPHGPPMQMYPNMRQEGVGLHQQASGSGTGWQGGLSKAGLEAQAKQEEYFEGISGEGGGGQLTGVGVWASSGIYHRSRGGVGASGIGERNTGPKKQSAGQIPTVAAALAEEQRGGSSATDSAPSAAARVGSGGVGEGVDVAGVEEDAGYACSAPSSLDDKSQAGERASGEMGMEMAAWEAQQSMQRRCSLEQRRSNSIGGANSWRAPISPSPYPARRNPWRHIELQQQQQQYQQQQEQQQLHGEAEVQEKPRPHRRGLDLQSPRPSPVPSPPASSASSIAHTTSSTAQGHLSSTPQATVSSARAPSSMYSAKWHASFDDHAHHLQHSSNATPTTVNNNNNSNNADNGDDRNTNKYVSRNSNSNTDNNAVKTANNLEQGDTHPATAAALAFIHAGSRRHTSSEPGCHPRREAGEAAVEVGHPCAAQPSHRRHSAGGSGVGSGSGRGVADRHGDGMGGWHAGVSGVAVTHEDGRGVASRHEKDVNVQGQQAHGRYQAQQQEMQQQQQQQQQQLQQQAEEGDTAQPMVLISVRDTGIGIPSGILGRLFQCFRQGHETMARRYGGTGLGLAISKRLAELMGGTVWVDSEGRGCGSCFHLCIPARFAWLPSSANPSATLPPSLAFNTSATPPSSSSLDPTEERAADSSAEVPHPGSVSSFYPEPQADSPRALQQQGLICISPQGDFSENEHHPALPKQQQQQHAAHQVLHPPSPAPTNGRFSLDQAQQNLAVGSPELSHCSEGFGALSGSGTSNSMGGRWMAPPADENKALLGKRVLVDLSHEGTAVQVCQSCECLGMIASRGNASCPINAKSSSGVYAHDVAVVGIEHAAVMLRAGWKGRPVVVVGPHNQLPTNLQPLVVNVSYPIAHARLANALIKATVLLKWPSPSPGHSSGQLLGYGPKLAHAPISLAQMADFQSWRNPGSRINHTTTGLLDTMAQQQRHSSTPTLQFGKKGPRGEMIPIGLNPPQYDPSSKAALDEFRRRSSLDNSLLDRSRVEMMLSSTHEGHTRASPGPPPVASKLPDHSPHALCGGIPEHSQYQEPEDSGLAASWAQPHPPQRTAQDHRQQQSEKQHQNSEVHRRNPWGRQLSLDLPDLAAAGCSNPSHSHQHQVHTPPEGHLSSPPRSPLGRPALQLASALPFDTLAEACMGKEPMLQQQQQHHHQQQKQQGQHQQQQQQQLPLVAELTAPMHAPLNVLAQPFSPPPPQPASPLLPSFPQQPQNPPQTSTQPPPHQLQQQPHPTHTSSPSHTLPTHTHPAAVHLPPPCPTDAPQGMQQQEFNQGNAQGSPCSLATTATPATPLGTTATAHTLGTTAAASSHNSHSSSTSIGGTGSCPSSLQPVSLAKHLGSPPCHHSSAPSAAQPPPQPTTITQPTASLQPLGSPPCHHSSAPSSAQPPTQPTTTSQPIPAASSPWGNHPYSSQPAAHATTTTSKPSPALLASDAPSSSTCNVAAGTRTASMPGSTNNLAATVDSTCGVAARTRTASMPGSTNNLAATVSSGNSNCSSMGVMAGQAPAGTAFPPRILIAEDNKVNQKVVLKVLQQVAGSCKPDVVENGLQVLRALEEKVYDLILMDIHMPEMDGLEATRCIMQRFPQGMRPRIIALSADTLKALHDRCREAGIEEFLEKPFRVEDLQRVMQSCSLQGARKRAGSGFKQPILGPHAMPTLSSATAHKQTAQQQQQQQQQQQVEHASSKGGVCGAA